MAASGQILAPGRNDPKRYSVEITNNSNPALMAFSRQGNRAPSLYEVAPQVSANTKRAKILRTDYPSRTEQNRKRLIAKPAKLAFDSRKSQRAACSAVFQALETMCAEL